MRAARSPDLQGFQFRSKSNNRLILKTTNQGPFAEMPVITHAARFHIFFFKVLWRVTLKWR